MASFLITHLRPLTSTQVMNEREIDINLVFNYEVLQRLKNPWQQFSVLKLLLFTLPGDPFPSIVLLVVQLVPQASFLPQFSIRVRALCCSDYRSLCRPSSRNLQFDRLR
jgi:hypothetical protein